MMRCCSRRSKIWWRISPIQWAASGSLRVSHRVTAHLDVQRLAVNKAGACAVTTDAPAARFVMLGGYIHVAEQPYLALRCAPACIVSRRPGDNVTAQSTAPFSAVDAVLSGTQAMSHDLPELPSIQPGRYRHYKGGEYEVLGVVRHSESLEAMVLYRPLYNDSGYWVRPFRMFLETVEQEGRRQPRFSPIFDR